MREFALPYLELYHTSTPKMMSAQVAATTSALMMGLAACEVFMRKGLCVLRSQTRTSSKTRRLATYNSDRLPGVYPLRGPEF